MKTTRKAILKRSAACAALTLFAACTTSPAALPPDPGHFVDADGEGTVEIIWSIPEDEQPPFLDGAAGVLTADALGRFNGRLGRHLADDAVLYEGTATVGDHDAEPVVTTWSTFSGNVYGADFPRGTHELDMYGASSERRTGIRQDRTWATLEPENRPADGMGSAWLNVETASGERVHGRCIGCMTILEEQPVDRIMLEAGGFDPDDGPFVDIPVQAELRRVTSDTVTLEVLDRLWSGRDGAHDLAEAFLEIAPGVWEYEYTDRTYLRCKTGGSRLVDYRTTWRFHEGAPALSGFGDIEVFDAAACENFDYGGAS